MFRATLKEQLLKIFELKKVTYDLEGESNEQECLFVEVETCSSQIKDGVEIAKVTGSIKLFAAAEKIPYGYFQKKIKQADLYDTRNLFFYNIENNTNVYRNIVERGMDFIYFYTSQYDPNIGTITSIEISEDA